MDVIPNHVLKKLIALGEISKCDDAGRHQLYDSLRPFDSCGRTHANAWIAATDGFSLEELSSLARGLVVAEESMPGWNGGSVSGVIWIFRAYQKKAPEKADALANWILENSTNPFVPYGSNRAGVKSIAEYEEFQQAKEQRRARLEKHSEAEQRCKEIREKVTRRHQQEKMTLQNAKAKARQALLTQLDNTSAKERLEHIPWDDEHDLTFYPENYADVTPIEFDSLDEISRQRLISKISPRHKGQWAKLFEKVTH